MRLLIIFFIISFLQIRNNCPNNQDNNIKMMLHITLCREPFQMFYVERSFRTILYNAQVQNMIRLATVGIIRGQI